MKVVTPRLNCFPLSSTLGHGVSVLASGRLPGGYLGYATNCHSPSWASRATTGHFFEDKAWLLRQRGSSSSWRRKVVYVTAVVQFFDKLKNSFFLSCPVSSSFCYRSLKFVEVLEGN